MTHHADVLDIEVGARVVLVQSGWSGTVTRHVRASREDAPFTKAYMVLWDRTARESLVRAGGKRLRRLEGEKS